MRQRSWWVGCTVLVAACSGGDGKAGADGKNGLNALVATSVVEAGDDCVAGGYQVRSGQDLDDDGKLSTDETRSTDYICNGAPGEPGGPGSGSGGASDGANGGDGTDGVDGVDGADGAVSLVTVTTLAPGADCSAGGLRLEAGLDEDASGSLDAGEVTTSRALCNGEPGSAASKGDPGVDSLIVTHPEGKGDNCKNGGIRIDIGQDADRSATLAQAEIASSSYVCNGADGAPGATGAKGADGATGATGAKGADGALGATGAKGANGTNGTNGTNGIGALIVTAPEPPGAHCAYGGTVVTTGLDDGTPSGTAGNGVLEAGEVDAAGTTYLCRPELTLEDLLATAGEAVSLQLSGSGVSADFAIVHDLGTESVVVENVIKGITMRTPGASSYLPATLQGRFTGNELADLVTWRTSLENTSKVANLTLTATDLSTSKVFATWTLSNAWPRSLEIEELASGGDPVVTVELIYEGLVRSKTATATITSAVQLTTGTTVDTTCASVAGIGSSSDVVVTNIKGVVTTRPGGVDVGDASCARPVDGDLDLNEWRRLLIANSKLEPMTITLSDNTGFDFVNSWPSRHAVDTGADGKLVETAIIVSDSYERN